MDCPKCEATMEEKKYRTIHGNVMFDQCTGCKGFWFDSGEAEKIKDAHMPDYIDLGDPEVGKEFNKIRDIKCPRCDKQMDKVTDPKQRHIEFESCAAHGVFMDAGEFVDYANETVMDVFRGVAARLRGS